MIPRICLNFHLERKQIIHPWRLEMEETQIDACMVVIHYWMFARRAGKKLGVDLYPCFASEHGGHKPLSSRKRDAWGMDWNRGGNLAKKPSGQARFKVRGDSSEVPREKDKDDRGRQHDHMLFLYLACIEYRDCFSQVLTQELHCHQNSIHNLPPLNKSPLLRAH